MMGGKRIKRKLKRRFLNSKVFSWLAYLLIRSVSLTIHHQWIGLEKLKILRQKGRPIIFVFWHGRLFMIPFIHAGQGACALISHHGDGELIAGIIRHFGYRSIRGSTSRGGMTALRKLAREIRNGADAGIAPDGPRGPRYQVQSGAVLLAHLTGCPLMPVTFSASKKKCISSWDRFLIPYPFSKGVFIYGDPIWIGREESRKDLDQKRQILEKILNKITTEADGYYEAR